MEAHPQDALVPGLWAFNLVAWNAQCQAVFKARIMNVFNIPSDDAFQQIYFAHIPEGSRPRFVDPNDYLPFPLVEVANVTNDVQKAACVRADMAELRERFNRKTLELLVNSREYRRRGVELLLPFPPNLGTEFNISVSKWLNWYVVSEFSWPVHLFHSVAFPDLRASHAIYRKLPAFHTTDACHTRDENGELVVIDIDREVLEQGGQETNWDLANFDNFGGLATQELYPQDPAELMQPPPAALRNLPAYQNIHPNKSRCPENLQALRERIGDARVQELDDLLKNQHGYAGGISEYMSRNGGLIMVMPGNWVEDRHIAIHPHHLNKQSAKVLGVSALTHRIWDDIKQIAANVLDRVQRLLQRAGQIRAHILVENYEEAPSHEASSGRHAYAHSNVLGAIGFFFLHDDRQGVHLVNHRLFQEHSNSFIIQVIAPHDAEMVHVVGLDNTNAVGCSQLMSWEIGCPSIQSFHVANGPASNPILGSIITVIEDFYRATLSPTQFRIATPRTE